METPLGSKRKFTVALYEAIGSMLFMYCILVSTADALAIAMSLFSMIVVLGSVSGGHFNPAVTIGVYIAKKEHYR